MRLDKGKKFQLQICLMIIALVLQSIVPVFSNNTFAEGIENKINNEETTPVEMKSGVKVKENKEEPTEGDDKSIEEEAKPVEVKPVEEKPVEDKPEIKKENSKKEVNQEKQEDKKVEEEVKDEQDEQSEPIDEPENLEEEPELETYAAPKDLGNIFTLESFKVNGVDADQNQVVTINDGTSVKLDYTWSVEDANPGDFAEIDIPEAFKVGANFEQPKPIELSGGQIVGTYKIVNNKLRFDFNEGIADPTVGGNVENGTLGFAVKFNKESFNEDVVEEIEFNDKSDKTITIIGKPTGTVKSIAKKGTPDSTQDAEKITWVVDVANPNSTEIINGKVKDVLPAGLAIDPASVKVENLAIALNGDLNPGSVTNDFTKTVNGSNFEVNFAKIAPFTGYRVTYTTTITDFAKASFTNDASLVDGSNVLKAKATVDVVRSSSIEKDGRIKGENIEWNIDINKASGSITNASVEDNLPTGTTLVPGSMKILKLTKNGDTWTESSSGINASEFPVSLGDLGPEDTYRIKFETSIDYSKVNNGEYTQNNEFKNIAILKSEGSEVGTAEKTVKISRKSILRKEGNAAVNYNDKTLTWKVHVNEAKHTIKNAVITDTLPKGLTIDEADIKIYDVNDNNKLVPSSDYQTTITPNTVDGTTQVIIKLGNIDKNYRIEYTTKITDFTINEFKNGVSIGGKGVGVGPGTGDTPIVKPIKPPANSYSKSSSGIDYDAKTIDWTIATKPTREAISELTITDTFPNKGLILLPETLKVKLGSDTLVKDTNYTLTAIDGNYKNGFIVKFIGYSNAKPINADVNITFSTSYDPEEGIDANTSTDYKYKNNANFVGKTINDNKINTNREAERKVINESWNSGKKLGKLISVNEANNDIVDGWMSGNERKIKWEVYTNYLEQNLGTGVTITDQLGYEGKVDTDSIEVRKYTVAKDGKTTIGEPIDENSYTVESINDKEFILKFKSEVKERYVMVFTTSVPDISQKTYENTATTKTDSGEYPYSGSIGFTDAGKEITKKSLTTGTTVYTDDEVNWNIQINKSLSTIQKDVTVVDTISKGLVYKKGSLVVSELIGTEKVPVSEDKYTLTDVVNEDGTTILTVTFKDSISSTHEIDYTTIVTATTGKVNNIVEYSGKNLEMQTIETTKLKAEQSSYVGGDTSKGKIEVSKVDTDGKIITSSEAKFKVSYLLNGEERLVGEFTTKKGKLELGNLTLNRTYIIEEVEAPQGYIGSNERFEIKVEKPTGTDGKGTYKQNVENKRIKRDIQFTKKGEDLDKNALEGAEFTLYSESDTGKPLGKSTSNNDGLVIFKDVEFGKYIIKETKVPQGYLPYTSDIKVTIDAKGQVTKIEDIVNTKIRGNIEIEKVDESNDPLKGANFGLYEKPQKEFAEPILSVKSDKNGKVLFENVPYGDYIIKEIEAPDSYAPSTKEISVSIKENGVTVKPSKNPIVNEKIIGDIEVIKFGENEDVTLKGAEFALEKDGVEKYTGKTDDQGRYVFKDVVYGTYILKETKAPKGYNLSTQTQEVKISEYNQEVITVKFENAKIRGSIKLKKIDENGKILKGAEFSIYELEDKEFENALDTVTSNKNGEVIFEDVEYGKYKIKETKAPEGYVLSDKVQKAEIETQGQIIELEDITNETIRGDIEFTKKDNEGNFLPGVVFTLYEESDTEFTNPIQIRTSSEKGLLKPGGQVKFDGIEYGNYVIKETDTPVGYVASNKLIRVSVTEDGKLIELDDVINTRIRGNIELTKKDNERNLLPGAEFGIYNKDTKDFKDPIQTQTSDKNGTVRFTGIAYGDYVIKEIKAPVGYILSDKMLNAEIRTHEQRIKLDDVINTRVRADVELVKKDNEGNLVSGAEFGIYDKDDRDFKRPIQRQVSDRNGFVRFSNMPVGEYLVKEISAPAGYLISDNVASVKVTQRDHRRVIRIDEVENTRVRANIKFVKKDNERNLLEGATFGIYDKDDKNFKRPIQTQASDRDGVVIFTNIPVGEYLVKEISAPEGYLVSDKVASVKVTQRDHRRVIRIDEVENTRVRASIKFVKKDNERNLLEGATFGIYDKDNKDFKDPIQTQVSDKDGVVRFINIPVGEYVVKEISAPAGYIASDKTASVKVTERNHQQVIDLKEVMNIRIRASVDFVKKDNEGNILSGATFGIYNKNTKDFKDPIQTQTSDKSGTVRFTDIPVGEYLVKEISAPTGYIVSDNVTSVKVTQKDHRRVFRLDDVINTRVRASVEFVKKDNEGNLLSGAEFGIYDKDNKDFKKPIQTQISDKDGIVRFTDIPVGEYLVKEISAPTGYIASDKIISVKVTQEDHQQVVKLDDMINKKIRGSIEILKRDKGTKKPLKGAEIAVYTEDDVLIGKKVSGEDGKVIFEELEYGKYYYQEIKAPTGYILDSSKHSFVIETDGVKLEEHLNNKIEPTKPEGPEEPGKPGKPEGPEKPGKPGTDSTSKPGQSGSIVDKLPQTGQNSNVVIYLVAALLLIVGFAFRKKKSNN